MFNVNVECQMPACLVKMMWIKDQHDQAQQWLLHAQARAQAQDWIIPRLSMHDPMPSLSPSLSMQKTVAEPEHGGP